jgi:hypothetical protein
MADFYQAVGSFSVFVVESARSTAERERGVTSVTWNSYHVPRQKSRGIRTTVTVLLRTTVPLLIYSTTRYSALVLEIRDRPTSSFHSNI